MGCCGNSSAKEDGGANAENTYAMEKLKGDETEVTVTDGSGKYGPKREFDPTFKGPTNKRSCTDIPCLLLFLVALAGYATVAIFAIKNGNPKILLRPTDFRGNVCGFGDKENRTKLLFFDMLKCARSPGELAMKGCPTPQICVESCPSENWVWVMLQQQEEICNCRLKEQRRKYLICKEEVVPEEDPRSVQQLIKEQACAPYYLQSADFFGRCVPRLGGSNMSMDMVNANGDQIVMEQLINGSVSMGQYFNRGRIPSNLLSDLSHVWKHLLIFTLLAALLCFTWCMVLQFFAGLFVYLTLSLFFVGFACSTAYCYYRYAYQAPNTIDWSNLIISLNPSYYLNFKETWLIFAIISCLITVIVLLILVCLCAQIQLAIALLGEATKAVAGNILTLLFPILPFLMELVVLAIWGVVAVHLASVGQPVFYSKANNSLIEDAQHCAESRKRERLSCYFVKYGGSDWAFYMHLYNVFMGFWMSCFVTAFGELVLASTFAMWYWAFDKSKDMPSVPLLRSMFRALFYHAGSLAFGSLIIATTKFIRFLLNLMQRNMQGSQNSVTKFFFCCLKCCFWCLEKVLKFLSKNAYIMMAIHGHSFLFSAKDAFFLIMRNILRVAVLNGVTSFILGVGKLLMSGSAAALAFLFFDHQIPYTLEYVPQLNYLWVPVVLVFVITWIIASLFFNVFDFATDTLFLCVMEDLERNDGTEEKPYFMSRSVQQTLNKRNVEAVERRRQGCGICCC